MPRECLKRNDTGSCPLSHAKAAITRGIIVGLGMTPVVPAAKMYVRHGGDGAATRREGVAR